MQINQEIIDIVEAIKSVLPLEQIYLFGSYAYGNPTESSDYDIFLMLKDNSNIKILEAIQKAHSAILSLNHTKSVDILADYKSVFNKRKEYNTLEKTISNRGKLLYG